jgi:regulator of replication initiation timing
MNIDELDLNSLRIEFRNLERAHQEAHKKLATLEARAVELVDEADALRAALGKLTGERDAAWTAWEKGAMHLADAKRERDSAKEWASQMVTQTMELKMEAYGLREGLRTNDATPAIEAAEREIADAQAQRDIANKNNRTLFDAWEKASRELDEARAEIERLRTKKAAP